MHWLLLGSWWLHSHRRRGERELGSHWHRGRQHSGGHRCGAAPTGDVALGAGQGFDQHVVAAARILVFIHQDEADTSAMEGRDAHVAARHLGGLDGQVIEINLAGSDDIALFLTSCKCLSRKRTAPHK